MTTYRKAWTMRLRKGAELDYDAAHAAVWPELLSQMRTSGIRRFFLFRSGQTIFAFQERDHPFPAVDTAPSDTTARWWARMAELMETDPSGRPIHYPLNEVFALTETETDI
ncbi:L-rhamnose mutarotase [Shimia biformata]|uniref:L-rhamnose mutarotase n=1 Tax=Shimia biformata TaxID=1294299 RepID=UPI0019506C74|nr:L-rhamnose mutarotase [Shimia biformata]